MFRYSDIPVMNLIIIGDAGEGLTLRSVLESFQVNVQLHYVGNVQHFLSLFEEQKFLSPFLLISCHGNEEGLILPELSLEIEKQMPISSILKKEDIIERINLNQNLILNTGCCLGKEDFAQAFIMKGAKAYIGIKGYIEASAIVIFMTTFFYSYFIQKMTVENAFYQARNINSETQHFHLFNNQKP